jgi:hypothetical protein
MKWCYRCVGEIAARRCSRSACLGLWLSYIDTAAVLASHIERVDGPWLRARRLQTGEIRYPPQWHCGLVCHTHVRAVASSKGDEHFFHAVWGTVLVFVRCWSSSRRSVSQGCFLSFIQWHGPGRGFDYRCRISLTVFNLPAPCGYPTIHQGHAGIQLSTCMWALRLLDCNRLRSGPVLGDS